MKPVNIRLEPLGKTLSAPRGEPLQDLLFEHGVEFPCGGRGTCKGCRVRVLDGAAPVTALEERAFTPDELRSGWRLACMLAPAEDLVLEVAQWETAILTDGLPVEASGREGLGVAVDLGTTTLVAQLVDLSNGHVLGVRTALNPQAVHGGDVMSRVEAATSGGERDALTDLIRRGIGALAADLCGARPEVRDVVLVGNTVMHHLFCGYDVAPLAQAPFETTRGELAVFHPWELGWSLPESATVRFLPCLGGFVGSDILAGILATRLDQAAGLTGLIDLGTNGEIVFGDGHRMLCASTAAGPAFEGGRISMGMRASSGAISAVRLEGNRPVCHVIGDGAPRGICGSGLVDAAAAGLDLAIIASSGRLPDSWELAPPVVLTQADIRQLQLAKAAIAAGIRILLKRLGAELGDVQRVYLAGAFGNYVNAAGARRIGLFEFPLETVSPAGNTALSGARRASFDGPESAYGALRSRIEHVPLASDSDFEQTFVDSMVFPGG